MWLGNQIEKSLLRMCHILLVVDKLSNDILHMNVHRIIIFSDTLLYTFILCDCRIYDEYASNFTQKLNILQRKSLKSLK